MAHLSRIRLRLTWRQRRAFVLTVLGYQGLVWADVLLNEGRFGGNARTALAGVAFLLMAAATWWIGTSLTRRGLVVHALPPMVIPWEQVAAIEVQNQLGSQVVVVHHRDARGLGVVRRTKLSAPTTGPLGRDDEFQDKVRVLRTFWAAHRDTDSAVA
jgi:hypothetical protein